MLRSGLLAEDYKNRCFHLIRTAFPFPSTYTQLESNGLPDLVLALLRVQCLMSVSFLLRSRTCSGPQTAVTIPYKFQNVVWLTRGGRKFCSHDISRFDLCVHTFHSSTPPSDLMCPLPVRQSSFPPSPIINRSINRQVEFRPLCLASFDKSSIQSP